MRVRVRRRLEKRRCARGPADTQTAHGGESRTAPLWPGVTVFGGRQRTAVGKCCALYMPTGGASAVFQLPRS